MKKTISIIFAVSIIAATSIGAASINRVSAAQQIPTVKLDGKAIVFPDTQPYVNEDDRTLVPVRFVSEALGCKVEWEETRELVIISKADTRILLHIGDNSAIVNTKNSDVKKEFDTKAVLKNDRTMVPLRFVSETLGAGVAWDETNNAVIIRSDGTVEAVSTPTPAATEFPDIIIDHSTPKPTPTPDNVPRQGNPIIGNPYYVNGLNGKEDLERYVRLKDLFKYDDITSISGDDNQKDLGKVGIAYGVWNPYQKRVSGYLNATFSESDSQFNIEIVKYGDKEIQRLREIIDIGVIGSQEYKDLIYETVLNIKNGGSTGKIISSDGSYFYLSYNTAPYTKEIWGDEAFFVTIWR